MRHVWKGYIWNGFSELGIAGGCGPLDKKTGGRDPKTGDVFRLDYRGVLVILSVVS
jgi:hypothetical protein